MNRHSFDFVSSNSVAVLARSAPGSAAEGVRKCRCECGRCQQQSVCIMVVVCDAGQMTEAMMAECIVVAVWQRDKGQVVVGAGKRKAVPSVRS